MKKPAGETFKLFKFVEELDFREDDDGLEFPQKTRPYVKGNPRIRMENGNVIVWNDQHTTSLKVSDSVIEFCHFTVPSVMVITGKERRIACILSEDASRVLKLAGKFNTAKEFRELSYLPLKLIP
jgi:hypothetical protein